MKLDIAVPATVIPGCILFSTLSFPCTVLGLTALPCLLFSFHRLWSKAPGRKRSRLFYTWGLLSTLMMFYTFEFIVVGFREILLWENLTLVTLFVFMMFALYHAKKDPGVLRRSDSQDLRHQALIRQQLIEEDLQNSQLQDSIIDMDGTDRRRNVLNHSVMNGNLPSSTHNRNDYEGMNDQYHVTRKSIQEEEVTWVDSRPIKGAAEICHKFKFPSLFH